MTGRKAVTRQEAAEMYGVSFDSIRRAVNSGRLPAKTFGRRILIDVAELDDWFKGLDDYIAS